MKKTLIMLAAALICLSSCNQGVSTETHKRIVDSLVQLIPKPANTTSMEFEGQQYTIAPIADYMVLKEGANKQIHEWHYMLKNGEKMNWNVNKTRSAFLVPRNTLDTLINALNSQFVIFYFGVDREGTGAISLYYSGVVYEGNDQSRLKLLELNDADGHPCIFDMSYPCPTCDHLSVHMQSADVGGLPPSTIVSWVEGGDSLGLHGSITPTGNFTFYEDTDVTYTFKADRGYKISMLKVDDTVFSTNIPSSYTFDNVAGSHNISVKYTKQ